MAGTGVSPAADTPRPPHRGVRGPRRQGRGRRRQLAAACPVRSAAGAVGVAEGVLGTAVDVAEAVAVAVVVEDGGRDGSEAYGGSVAGPISSAVMKAALD